MNLYEIDTQILECVDAETGEIFDYEKFEALNLEKDVKIENTLLWIKNLKAQAKAVQEEKLNFAQRQKVLENQVERLENFITDYLGGNKWESAKVRASFRKSESVEIAEDAVIPEEYHKIKVEYDKTALKQAIKDGQTFDGVTILAKQNLQIK